MAEESTAPVKSFSLEDVAPHSSEKDCWLVIHGKVYDVTQFLDEHPGGYDIVVSNSGARGRVGVRVVALWLVQCLRPGCIDATRPLCIAGKDSTEDFDEIGHSKTAQDMLKDYYIGEFKVGYLWGPILYGGVSGCE